MTRSVHYFMQLLWTVTPCKNFSIMSRAQYGFRGSNAPWFMCWFRCYINCLFVCLLNFLTFFLLYCLLSSCFFLTYLLSYLFTSGLIYLAGKNVDIEQLCWWRPACYHWVKPPRWWHGGHCQTVMPSWETNLEACSVFTNDPVTRFSARLGIEPYPFPVTVQGQLSHRDRQNLRICTEVVDL